MFNVGAGEAVLIVFPNGRVWVVDCGSGNHIMGDNRILGKGIAAYLAANGLVLEAMVATHPHTDHGAGFPWLLDQKPALASDVMFIRAGEDWDRGLKWMTNLETQLAAINVEPIVVVDSHRVVEIQDDITAHFFAGHGADEYTSVWLHLRYKDAALLFTGDVECSYEKDLLRMFSDYDLTSDVLKITHHGSSSGTSAALVARVRQGMSLASSTDNFRHRLEADTLKRIGGLGNPRRVFETVIDGDITVRTDGGTFGNGVLYEVEFLAPGLFEVDIGAKRVTLAELNPQRDTANEPDCIQND